MKCKVCDSRKYSPLYSIKDIYSSEYFQLYRCNNCTHVFIGNCPEESEIGSYYKNDLGESMFLSRDNLSTKLQKILFRKDLKQLLKNINIGDAIIDWGAGNGLMSLVLKEFGFNVTAIDVFQKNQWKLDKINYLKVDSNIMSKTEILDVVKMIKPTAIVMRHSLEHMIDPNKLLNAFQLAGVKYLLIILPNENSFLKNLLRGAWYLWDPPRHMHFYNQTSLDFLLFRFKYKSIHNRTYGIDEIYNSFVRFLKLYFKTGLSFNNLISSICSVLSYPLFNSVLLNLYELDKNE